MGPRVLSERRIFVNGILLVVVALAGLVAGPAFGRDNPSPPSGNGPLIYVTATGEAIQAEEANHFLVTYPSGVTPAGFEDKVAELEGELLDNWPQIGVAVVGSIDNTQAQELAGLTGIDAVERDLTVQWTPQDEQMVGDALEVPEGQSDQSGAFFFPFYEWNLRQIDADDAWLTTKQGLGVTVAVLDTGIDPNHQDLSGKVDLTDSKSCITIPLHFSDSTIDDYNFHGTFVAALITSNGIDMASVAPDASLVAVKVLNRFGSGSFADVICGIVYAADLGVDVINLSLGAYFPKDLPGAGSLVSSLNQATNYAKSNGVFVVAAAGNLGGNLDKDRNFTFVPAQSANVLSVGATAPFNQVGFDNLAFYTNYGVSGVDVMAPGGNSPFFDFRDLILSACSGFVCGGSSFYTLSAGTSFAAPHAAGTAAVVKAELVKNPTVARVDHCLTKGADDLGKKGTDKLYSKGRINVMGAVACQ